MIRTVYLLLLTFSFHFFLFVMSLYLFDFSYVVLSVIGLFWLFSFVSYFQCFDVLSYRMRFIFEHLLFVWSSWVSFVPFFFCFGLVCDLVFHVALISFVSIFMILSMCVILRSLFLLIKPSFVVERFTIKTSKSLGSYRSINVVVLSDLHVNTVTGVSYCQALVSQVNQLKPDLIFIVGDVVSMSFEQALPCLSCFKSLKSKHGVYVVSGNDDYRHDFSCVKQYYVNELSWVYLSDHFLTVDACNICIFGIEDPFKAIIDGSDVSSLSVMGDCIRKNGKSDRFNLLLSHRNNPLLLQLFSDLDLQFSGHTHASQFWPLTWINVLCRRPFMKGLYEVAQRQFLFVSQGVGYSNPAMHRFGTQKEIVCCTISVQD